MKITSSRPTTSPPSNIPSAHATTVKTFAGATAPTNAIEIWVAVNAAAWCVRRDSVAVTTAAFHFGDFCVVSRYRSRDRSGSKLRSMTGLGDDGEDSESGSGASCCCYGLMPECMRQAFGLGGNTNGKKDDEPCTRCCHALLPSNLCMIALVIILWLWLH